MNTSLVARSKRASSLIFVMLVVAGVVTVTLGTQRLALVQFSQSVSDEDNLSAYYAAKAGIEDGLNRFRFNRNADTVQSANTYTAERYNLTTGQSVGYVQDDTAITSVGDYNPNHQYYDLKVAYRTLNLQNVAIAQDETFELTGFPDSTNNYYLHYSFTFPANQTGCFVAMQQVLQNTSGTQSYAQAVVNQVGSNVLYDSATQGTNLLIRTSAGGTSLSNMVRIRPFGTGPTSNCSVTASFSAVTGSSGATSANVAIDSTQTSITATGYFGTTKRTLIASVDRKSGQLINIYDFNAFAGTGDISP